MTLEELLAPVSEDAPCGPDLNETVDPEYDEYYFGALGRLPSFYFRPGVERPDGSRSPDQIFENGSVEIASERTAIESLSARSRDIRLLVLLAQWEILAGHLPQCAEAVDMIAGLLETFGDDLHPALTNGPGDRRDALGDLNNQVTMVQPLQFLGLTGTDEVSLRKIKVAAGDLVPLQAEEDLSPGMMSDALSDPGNRKRVEATHAELLKLGGALARIDQVCKTGTTPFTAPLAQVLQTTQEMLDALTAARPDLRGADIQSVAAAEAAEPDSDDTPPAEAESAPPAATAAPLPSGEAIAVASQDHARLILEGCEHYYRQSEPSSAALLLVTQARLLIGRPLIEALQTLLPESAGRALIDFGPQTGFALNIDRLRQLTDSPPQSPVPESEQPAEQPTAPAIRNGSDAAAAMRSVEDYFRRVERSSPVPILLQRARGYLDKDFQSLVDELLPKPETGGQA